MYRSQNNGFTLVELVMVIVISSIISVISVQFIVTAMQGVADTASRQQTAFTASLVAERISREVRQALPNSVRLFSTGGLTNNCVEFIPVIQASQYLAPLAGVSLGSWEVLSPGNVAGYVAVYPVSVGVIYPSGNAVTTGSLTFTSGNVVTVAMGGHTFPTDSPQRRFFVISQPVSICGDASGYVYRYSDYGFDASAGSSIASGTRETFVNGLSSLRFSYAPATLTRNSVVTFSATFRNVSDEPLTINQQVQVKNVP